MNYKINDEFSGRLGNILEETYYYNMTVKKNNQFGIYVLGEGKLRGIMRYKVRASIIGNNEIASVFDFF